jgi:perosamine synthetase
MRGYREAPVTNSDGVNFFFQHELRNMTKPLPANPIIPRISELERSFVLECLGYDFEASKGSVFSSRLERAFAERLGVDYAISFINGTATMHAALQAANIGPGDEVIVPPLTMASTAFAVLQAHAVPIFADIDPETFLIDPACIRERITAYTKGIIPVALYGLSPEMDEIMAIAEEFKLIVIEDDAECFANTYKGRLIGTMGHISSFSFQSTKHLTSGEGGMIVTNDEELATKVRRFNSLGYAGVGSMKGKITKEEIQDPNYSRHVSVGFNYRMPELCAAVALAQLERSEELVTRRIQVAELFLDALGGCDWMIPQKTPEHCTNSYWTFVTRLTRSDVTWHEFRNRFRSLGGDGIYGAWKLSYLEPMFANGSPIRHPEYRGDYQTYAPGLCPRAEIIQKQLLQFKTNYWNWSDAERQADILSKSIRSF